MSQGIVLVVNTIIFFEYNVNMGFSSQRKKCYMAAVMARANQEFSLNTASLSPKISTILQTLVSNG